MTQQRKIAQPMFFVRLARGGQSWSVFCVTGFGHSVEVPDFSCEKAGHYWIDNVSKMWLEN